MSAQRRMAAAIPCRRLDDITRHSLGIQLAKNYGTIVKILIAQHIPKRITEKITESIS